MLRITIIIIGRSTQMQLALLDLVVRGLAATSESRILKAVHLLRTHLFQCPIKVTSTEERQVTGLLQSRALSALSTTPSRAWTDSWALCNPRTRVSSNSSADEIIPSSPELVRNIRSMAQFHKVIMAHAVGQWTTRARTVLIQVPIFQISHLWTAMIESRVATPKRGRTVTRGKAGSTTPNLLAVKKNFQNKMQLSGLPPKNLEIRIQREANQLMRNETTKFQCKG